MHFSKNRTQLPSPFGWVRRFYHYLGLLLLCGLSAGASFAAPTVTSITMPGDSVYNANFVRREHWLGLRLNFSEPITVKGMPGVVYRVGSSTFQSNSILNVTTNSITFDIAPNDYEEGSLTVTGPIVLYSGDSIKGADGSDAVLTFAEVSAPGVIMDTVPPPAPTVIDVTPASPNSEEKFTIRGTSALGTSISYMLDNTVSGDAAVDAEGNWSVTLGPANAGAHSFGATARDSAGNFTDLLGYMVTGINFTVQPAPVALAPKISAITNTSPMRFSSASGSMLIGVQFSAPVQITGHPMLALQIGDKLRMSTFYSYNTSARTAYFIYNILADDYGRLTVTGPLNLNGGTIQRDGVNADLNFAPFEASNVFGSAPPAPPVVNQITPASPTTAETFTIQGAASFGTVYYQLDGGQQGSVQTNQRYEWSVTLGPVASPGDHTFTAYVQDSYGTSSQTTVHFTVKAAPVVPTVDHLVPPAGSSYGPGRSLLVGVAFSAPVTVTGTPQLGVSIGSVSKQLNYYTYSNNTAYFQLEVQADDHGALRISGPLSLNGGTIRGESGGLDADLAVTAADTATFIGSAPAAPTIAEVVPTMPTTSEGFVVRGTAEANATVDFTLDQGQAGTTVVDAEGNWSANFGAVTSGQHTFMASARNGAGASPTASKTFTVQQAPATSSSEPPPRGTAALVFAPVITDVMPVVPTVGDSFTIRGTAAPDATVAYTLDQIQSGSIATDGNGNWSVTFGSAVAGEHVFEASTQTTEGGSPIASFRFTVQTSVGAGATAPTITALAFSSPGTYPAGQTLLIEVTFSVPVTVTGTPSFTANIGTTPRPFTYAATQGNTVQFTYQTLPGDSGLLTVISPFLLSGGTIRSAAGTDAALDFVPVGTGVSVDAAAVARSRLINLSSRLQVGDGNNEHTMIMGFYIRGSGQKQVLVRGVGPALAGFGVQAPLANPRVRLFNNTGGTLQESDDWSGAEVASTAARVGAFPLSAGSRDAAMVQALAAGSYSVHVLSNGGSGVTLAEIYDASQANDVTSPALANLSTRGFVGAGESQMGAGFVISGAVPMRVLIRGVGPALASFGVTDGLSDPVLTVYQSSTVIARNDNWETAAADAGVLATATAADVAAAARATGAFALPAGGKDAALLLTLPPGNYTAYVSGTNGATGVGLVEVYEVQ